MVSCRNVFDEKPKRIVIDYESKSIILDGEKIMDISYDSKITITSKYLQMKEGGADA